MSSNGTFALEVLSIREHGVTCKITDEGEGACATLPKAMVTTVLEEAGKDLKQGERLFITLSVVAPAASMEDSAIEMRGVGLPPASDARSGSHHSHGNGNNA